MERLHARLYVGTTAERTALTPAYAGIEFWDTDVPASYTWDGSGWDQPLLADGSIPLTADWDIGDGRKILADAIWARDGAGLGLYDDAGNGIFVADGGAVRIQPGVDSTTAFQVNQADTTNVLTVDTTNKAFQVTGATSLIADTSTTKPLIVKAAASQSANLQEWQDSGGNVFGQITSDGYFDFRMPIYLAPAAEANFIRGDAFYNHTSLTMRCASFSATHYRNTDAVATLQAFHGYGRKGGSGNLSNLQIFIAEGRLDGSGTLSALYGFYSALANTGVGTINHVYNLRAASTTNTGGGSILNLYGLYINNMTAATNNYAIYTNAGAVHFGDKVQFTQTDGNEAIDSLADGYMDYLATTRHRFNAPITVADKALLGSPVAGTFEFDNDRMYLTNVGTQRAVDRTSDVITSTTTVSNTVVETTIYTATIGADDLKVGNVIKLFCFGELTNATAADDITIKIKIGATTLQTFNPAIGNVTDAHWHTEIDFTIRTVGAAGTAAFHGHTEIAGNDEAVNTESITVDTTAAANVTVTITWDNAKAGNSISVFQGYAEFKN